MRCSSAALRLADMLTRPVKARSQSLKCSSFAAEISLRRLSANYVQFHRPLGVSYCRNFRDRRFPNPGCYGVVSRSISVEKESQQTDTEPVTSLESAWSIYDHPELYDRAFSDRDIPAEVGFLFEAFSELSEPGRSGESLQRFVELGCGPARHSIEAALRGARQVTAVDESPDMLAFARKLSAKSGASVSLLQGRMEELFCNEASVPEEARDADLVLMALGTFSHALTNDDALEWLAAAGNLLRPGGLLVLELADPREIFDSSLMQGDEWEVEGCDNEDTLKVVYGTPDDEFNPYTQVLDRYIAVSRAAPAAAAAEGGGEWELLGECTVPQRVFTLQEVMLLVSAAGFIMEGVFGEMSLDVDLEDEEAYRMVVVLSKPALEDASSQTGF